MFLLKKKKHYLSNKETLMRRAARFLIFSNGFSVWLTGHRRDSTGVCIRSVATSSSDWSIRREKSLTPTCSYSSTICESLSIFFDITPKLNQWCVLKGYLQCRIWNHFRTVFTLLRCHLVFHHVLSGARGPHVILWHCTLVIERKRLFAELCRPHERWCTSCWDIKQPCASMSPLVSSATAVDSKNGLHNRYQEQESKLYTPWRDRTI